jgi:hypothetical protein
MAGAVLLMNAITLVPASYVNSVRRMGAVFSVMLGSLLFDEPAVGDRLRGAVMASAGGGAAPARLVTVGAVQPRAGAATEVRRSRQSGIVVSTTTAMRLSVAGAPTASPTKPYSVGPSAEAPMLSV